MENLTIEQQAKIDDLLQYGYNLRIGTYIKTAFRLYFKYFWAFVGLTAILVLVSLLSYSFNSLKFLGSGGLYLNYLFLSPLIGALTTIIGAGYYFMGQKIYLSQNKSFENFFDGTNFWKPLALAYLITYVISIIFFMVPFSDIMIIFSKHYSFNSKAGPDIFPPILKNFWLALLFILIGIYFSISFKWTTQLIIFYKMSYIKALITSLRLITKQWFSFLIFYIAIIIIITVPLIIFTILIVTFVHSVFKDPGNGHLSHLPGMYLTIIPALLWLFFLMPVYYLSLYASFEDILGIGLPQTKEEPASPDLPDEPVNQ
jgi:hypothetical protein